MRTTTYFYNAEGQIVKKHSGEPRNANVFEKNATDAVRVEIFTVSGYNYSGKVFHKENDRWVGEIYRTSNGYHREVIERKRTLMHRVIEQVSDQEALSIIKAEVASLMPAAREAVRWCRKEDEQDPEGRYWLSAYAGAEVYRLIVQDRRILGSIPGGYHDSRPLNSSIEAWMQALTAAIEEKVTGEYRLIKADGSGTYFFIRNQEDSQYLFVKEYDVPSIHGGFYHNIEVL